MEIKFVAYEVATAGDEAETAVLALVAAADEALLRRQFSIVHSSK